MTPTLLFDIHRTVTEDTLDDHTAAGRLRRTDEEIVVKNLEGVIFHYPPDASELPARVEAMCRFANGGSSGDFVHPVLRAIILHFWLAYDHPFVDGNGRTARALFYWSMLHHGGYWLFEYLSISRVILHSRRGYDDAFLFTESDANDLTYFLLHQTEVICKAMDDLHQHIQRQVSRLRETKQKIHQLSAFNHRQQALIDHALRHPGREYTVNAHMMTHNITPRTARIDLVELSEKGLLSIEKARRPWRFVFDVALESRLRNLSL